MDNDSRIAETVVYLYTYSNVFLRAKKTPVKKKTPLTILPCLLIQLSENRQEEVQEPQHKYKVVHGNGVKNINQDGRQVR